MPWKIGIGTISCRPMQNGPAIVKSAICGSPPPFGVPVSNTYANIRWISYERRRIPEARHRALLQRIEPADFVEAEDVIGVAVREDHRVHAPKTEPQRLRAQVRPRVHQDGLPVVGFDVDGRAGARVARIWRRAGRAVAADHRHAVRRAGAQEGDLHGWMMRVSPCWAWTNLSRSS